MFIHAIAFQNQFGGDVPKIKANSVFASHKQPERRRMVIWCGVNDSSAKYSYVHPDRNVRCETQNRRTSVFCANQFLLLRRRVIIFHWAFGRGPTPSPLLPAHSVIATMENYYGSLCRGLKRPFSCWHVANAVHLLASPLAAPPAAVWRLRARVAGWEPVALLAKTSTERARVQDMSTAKDNRTHII
jgi:hypothetical protein